MTRHQQIGQIYCSENTHWSSSLAAVVSTLEGCIARVDSKWSDGVNSEHWKNVFLVISHLDCPDATDFEDQLRMVRESRKTQRFPEFIFVSDKLTLEQHSQLLEAGATDVLVPPTDLRRLRYLIESRKISHGHYLDQQGVIDKPNLVQCCSLQKKIDKIANLDTNILLSGETGVGKTFVAEQIHRASKRAKHPFVVVDCSTIPTNLVESELFGHAKGAFTDACARRMGQFEHVGAGTILLDEIDSLPLDVQAKLLRVVEKHEFRRVGENNPIQLKARIISATNLNLNERVKKRKFRADLYFRLNAYEIKIPKLSKRKNEIEHLCHLFATEFGRENKQVKKIFGTGVMDLFCQYDWPGNLRELRNCVFHGAIDSEDAVIRLENLPEPLIAFEAERTEKTDLTVSTHSSAGESSKSNGLDLQFYSEAQRLILALANNQYNRSLTAKELGVSRMTVYNMMKRHHFG